MLNRRTFLRSAAAGLSAAMMGPAVRAQANRPNILVLFTDDQGYHDLGCMGADDLKTPNIDGLAASGARCTNWYSNSPGCSPSRASLLTGRYPIHAGVRNILPGHRHDAGLPLGTPTLASALKKLGYRTGITGKWHLGAAAEYQPQHFGFDETFGFNAGCIDFYSHIFYWGSFGKGPDPVHDLWENGEEIWEDGRYFTELITERATRFIDDAANDDEPFFLYVPYNAPHYPMHAPQHYLDRFPEDMPWERRIMAAMLAAVDDSVGTILDTLDRHGLRDNTLIFYSSDNGPSRETRNWMDGTTEPYRGGSAAPLKGHKFSLFEGGIRMPGIVSWPGHIPAGTTCDGVAAMMDIFPTALAAAGGDPSEHDIDGKDILPMLAQGGPTPHEAVFWEYHDQLAVRSGNLKLTLRGGLYDKSGPQETPFLADVVTDPGETTNLASARPEDTARLTKLAEEWFAYSLEKYKSEWSREARGQ